MILLTPITFFWFIKERQHRRQILRQKELGKETKKDKITSKQHKLVALLNSLYHSDDKLADISAVATFLSNPEYGVNDVVWVMLDHKIYDLTHFNHPGGNFIVQAVKGYT